MRSLRSLAKPGVPLVALGAAMWLATPALAHIHTDPEAVEAGQATTVGFIVEHGCAGSSTTGIDLQLPDGSKDVSGVDGDGFTSTVKDGVVTFTGGPLDAETEKAFQVTLTPPAPAGDVPVKMVQTCEKGQLDWIEVAKDGEPEPEHPAPVLKITAGTPTEGDAAGDHEEAAGEQDHAAEGTDHDDDAETAAGPAATVDNDDDSSSNTSLYIGIGVAVVVGVGAALYGRSRQGDASPTA